MPATPIQKILDSYADVPLYQFSLKCAVPNTPVFTFLDSTGRPVGTLCSSVSAIVASGNGGVEISLLSYYRQIIGDTTGASGIPLDAVGFVIGRANGVQIGQNGRRDGTVPTNAASGQAYNAGYVGLGTGFYLVPNKKTYSKNFAQVCNFTYTTWVSGTIVASFYDKFGEQVTKGTTVGTVSGTTYDMVDLGGIGYAGAVFYSNTGVVYYDWSGDKTVAPGGELRIPANAALMIGTAPLV